MHAKGHSLQENDRLIRDVEEWLEEHLTRGTQVTEDSTDRRNGIMPYENLDDGELVDRLVEVTLELDRLNAMQAQVNMRVLQDLGQAPDVDRSVDREYLEAIRHRPELDKLHVRLSTGVVARGLHEDLVKALANARKQGS